jgi:hypothetical protein
MKKTTFTRREIIKQGSTALTALAFPLTAFQNITQRQIVKFMI